MVVRYMPDSDPWGPPGTRVMTIFVFYVNPQVPNIENLKHMRSTNPGRYLIVFLIKFPIECRQHHVWRPIFDPSYDHVYKSVHFVKVELRDTHG